MGDPVVDLSVRRFIPIPLPLAFCVVTLWVPEPLVIVGEDKAFWTFIKSSRRFPDVVL